jgi:hypothetical protein
MTMLSIGAYVRQLDAIRTTAATFITGEDIVDQKDAWVMPATSGRPVVAPAAADKSSTIKTTGLAQGPFTTIELLTESIYDNVSSGNGQGFANTILWSDKYGNNHVVTQDVVNLLDLFKAMLAHLRKMPGLSDAEYEDFLIHVNDYQVTSPLARSSQQYTPHFGAQSMVICPNGKVMVLALDRLTMPSQATNRFTWRALNVKPGHEAALMQPTIDGFLTEEATGYIEIHGNRVPYFIRNIDTMTMTQPVCNNYVHRAANPDVVKPVPSALLAKAGVPVAR